MNLSTRRIKLRLALFDQGYTPAGGRHWVWYDSKLSVGNLDHLTYDVLSPVTSQDVLRPPSSPLCGGFASIDREWCCWFRIYDGGLDSGGRPGRFLVLAVYCERDEARGVDARWIFDLDIFETVSASARRPPPMEPPVELTLDVDALLVTDTRDLLDILRGKASIDISGLEEMRVTCDACSRLRVDEEWRLTVRGGFEKPTGKAELSPPPPVSSLSEFLGKARATDDKPVHALGSNAPRSAEKQQMQSPQRREVSKVPAKATRSPLRLAAIGATCALGLLAIGASLMFNNSSRPVAVAKDVQLYHIARECAQHAASSSEAPQYRKLAIKALEALADGKTSDFFERLTVSDRNLLAACRSYDAASLVDVQHDSDFDSLRNVQGFPELIKRLSSGQPTASTK